MPLARLAGCVELNELKRHLPDGAANSLLCPDPLPRSQSSNFGINSSRTVPRNAIALIDRDVELVSFGVLEEEVFALNAARVDSDETVESRNPVIDVNHVF